MLTAFMIEMPGRCREAEFFGCLLMANFLHGCPFWSEAKEEAQLRKGVTTGWQCAKKGSSLSPPFNFLRRIYCPDRQYSESTALPGGFCNRYLNRSGWCSVVSYHTQKDIKCRLFNKEPSEVVRVCMKAAEDVHSWCSSSPKLSPGTIPCVLTVLPKRLFLQLSVNHTFYKELKVRDV